MMKTFDAAIIGGGLAGASLAAALRGYPGRIALVEARPPDALRRDTFDERSIALADVSRRILDTLKLWDALVTHAHPIREIRVSEKGAFGATRICAAHEGLDALAWTLPHHALGEVLHANLHAVEQFVPATATGLSQHADRVTVTLEQAGVCSEIETRLLVLADGGGGGLCEAAGFDVAVSDYGQAAVVVNVETEFAAGEVAYERFTPHGPLAVLPLGGTRCGVVWTHAEGEADAVAAWPDARFIKALQSDFGRRLGRIVRVGARRVFPLRLAQASRMVAGRVVALGNAVHTLHPVAGQNFNLTLRDVAALAEGVFAARDAGAPGMLAAWQTARRADVRRVVRFTDFLARAFTRRWCALAPLRGAALLGFDLCPPLRRAVVRRSLGLLPPASRLASGLPLAPRSEQGQARAG